MGFMKGSISNFPKRTQNTWKTDSEDMFLCQFLSLPSTTPLILSGKIVSLLSTTK